MKTNIFFLVTLFLFINSAYTQSVTVTYEEKFGEKSNPAFLEYNEKISVYYKPYIVQNTKRLMSGNSEIRPANSVDSIANKPRYIVFRAKDSAFISNIINFDVEKQIKDKVSLSWQVTGETKKIIGHNCIKAVGVLHNRKYEAWYSPDTRVPYGPIKLNNLPGLILELIQPETGLHIVATDIKENKETPPFLNKMHKQKFENAMSAELYDEWRRQKLAQIEQEDNIKFPKNPQNEIELDCKNCNK